MSEPLVAEFMRYVHKKEAVVVLQVYLELCEIKRYYNVTYSFNNILHKITLQARKVNNGPTYMFIPITVNEELSFLKLQNILQLNKQQTMYLVIVHSDSTSVYYQLTNGLVQPTNTIAKHLKENRQEKIDSNIKRNKHLIEQGALFDLKVTIRKDKDEVT